LLIKLREVLNERGLLHGTVTLDDGSAEDCVFFSEAIQALEGSVVDAGGFGALGARTTRLFRLRCSGQSSRQDFEDLANEARHMGSVLVGRMNSFRRSMEQWRQRPGIPGAYLVRGKPRSTLLVPGSGQRLVTTLPRV